MSLRDDLLREMQEKQEKEKAVALAEQQYQRQKVEKEQAQKEEEKRQLMVQFEQLNTKVKNNDIPSDWQEVYERFVPKIKEYVLQGNTSFELQEGVTEQYYHQKYSVRKGKMSEIDLLNKYLTQRLKADGFNNAYFGLVDQVSYYATDEDYERQRQQQEINDLKVQQRYEADWELWERDPAGHAPDRGNYTAKVAKLKPTGQKHTYMFVVKGSLCQTASKKVTTHTKNINKIISAVIFVALGIFGFAFPYIFPPEVTVDVIGFGFGNPIASMLAFLAVGAIVFAIVSLLTTGIRNLRHKSNVKRQIVFIVIAIILIVAIIVAIVVLATR